MGWSCCEGRSTARTDRRTFLQGTLWALGTALMGPEAFLRVAGATGESTPERVLVVLQLSGGNDGLSMCVPFGDDAYYRARKQIAIPRDEVIGLDDYVGIHPNLAPLRPIFDRGDLALVQGVGYPKPNRSHFKSMDIWHAASMRGNLEGTGWLGRAIDALYPDDDVPMLLTSIGKATPLAMTGRIHRPTSLESPQGYRWEGDRRNEEAFERLNDGDHVPPEAGSAAKKLHRVAEMARASSARIAAASSRYEAKAEYPRFQPAQSLRLVASLIAGGLNTRVYYVQMGGFDTHARQRGRHDTLMLRLGQSVAAFVDDIQKQGFGDRVTLLGFSEFGRRVAQNGSGGTDHGAAGPMLLAGAKVQGGLHGEHPSLTDLHRGDLKMTTDFRSVYAAVTEDWLGAPAGTVLGEGHPKLGLIEAAEQPQRTGAF
jgi:uncharacterized protein (DUF1501 family)